MFPGDGRPGDSRNFIHKRLIGAVTGGLGGLFGGGNPITGAIGGFVRGGGGGARGQPAPIFAPSPVIPGGAFIPRAEGCGPGFFFDPRTRQCEALVTRGKGGVVGTIQEILPGGASGRVEFGAAVMGQYGAALEPGIRQTDTRVCPRGTVLGTDLLCYNRRDIKNSERQWPRGRRPLLTGGDMRCISIAAAAAAKIQKKTKQLQAMGMLKKPTSRRAPKLLHAHHEHSSHD